MGRRETNYKERKPASQADSELIALQPGPQAKPGRTELPMTESKLLHFVMFAGELFCFPQLLEGLVNVIHGGNSVPTPIPASMFQIVPGPLECPLCGLNFGGHVPLRGSWEKIRCGGYDHQRKDYEGSNFHGSSSGDKRRIDGQRVCDIACGHGNPGFC
jgi:hypothetical protein